MWWELIYFSVIPCILSFAYLIIEKWYYQDLRMITLGNAKRYLFKSSKTLTGLTLLIATALSGIGVMVFLCIRLVCTRSTVMAPWTFFSFTGKLS